MEKLDRETCPRSTRDFLALSVCLKLRPPRPSPFEQSLLEDETRHTGDGMGFRKSIASSQLNGRKADVSTTDRNSRSGKKRLLVVPPLSSLDGRARDLAPEGGEIKSSLARCL